MAEMKIVENLNLPEFAVITAGLLISEGLEKPLTDWGLNEDSKAVARVAGGEALALVINQLTPEEAKIMEKTNWYKILSYLPTAVAADGAARWIKPKIGLKTGAPQRVVIREPAKQIIHATSNPVSVPAPAAMRQTVVPPVKVGAALNEQELRSLGFGLA